jgi:hypothetical protein
MVNKMSDIMAKLIRQQLNKWKMTPKQVHVNDCDTFARRVLDKAKKEGLKVQPKVCDDTIHVFLVHNGRSYDAQSPHGVKDWRDLPDTKVFMKRNGRSKSSMKARNTKLRKSTRVSRINK